MSITFVHVWLLSMETVQALNRFLLVTFRSSDLAIRFSVDECLFYAPTFASLDTWSAVLCFVTLFSVPRL